MPFQQDPIRVTVENGQVSLEGVVVWHYQKLSPKRPCVVSMA
jgi:hypothetical protein